MQLRPVRSRQREEHCASVHMPVMMVSAVAMTVGTVLSLWWFFRLTRAVETLAMVQALDEMDTLSDIERADLEGRVRERLFG